jgi:serine/threonine-protein kinase HipA
MKNYPKEFARLIEKMGAIMSSKEVLVSIALGSDTVRVGRLWFHVRGHKTSASFEYDKKWLDHSEKFSLEPALKLTEGAFHTGQGISLFGAMGDSAPDRWGRMLMRRFEASQASVQNRAPRSLFEIDYLLGVHDEARQGALRFSISPDEHVFLSPQQKISIPPLVDLPKLLSATERFIDDNENSEDLRLLLAPGSSLGGARPKASVRDKDGSLAIAKFSKKDDEYNVVLWEAVVLTLAKKATIKVPLHRVETIGEKSVLIIRRFDRIGGNRIPFLSAMSMLGAHDNEQHSYLEMAYALAQNGAAPVEDMKELWRRMVFTIMVSNTDDHLRNHGFIYERHKGWRLSPAYDINPTPIDIAPRILTTSIDFYDSVASLETAMRVAKDFRLKKEEALSIIEEVAVAVKQWRFVASEFGLSKRACDRMASAFVWEKS